MQGGGDPGLDEAAEAGAPGDQGGGLAIDDEVVAVAVEGGVAGDLELGDLTLGHAGDGVGEGLDGGEAAGVGDRLKTAGEAEVAGQHGHAVAVLQPRGRPTAAKLAAVDDVVVQEGGRVQ